MTIIWCMVPEIWHARHNFLSFWTIFFPFTHLTTHKIKIFRKWKKCLEILLFYACRINDNHMICGSWDMERDRKNFSHFGPFFPLHTPSNPKNQNFEKVKKNCVTDRIFVVLDPLLPFHTPTYTCVPYVPCSWDIECSKQNFLSFWAISYLLTQWNPEKSRFQKNEKKCLEASLF